MDGRIRSLPSSKDLDGALEVLGLVILTKFLTYQCFYIHPSPDTSIFHLKLIFVKVTWREKHNYPPKPFVWSVYMFTHFIIILIIYESIGFFRNVTSSSLN